MGLVALAADVEKVRSTMRELETLETLLESENMISEDDDAAPPTSRNIELRSKIKKLMTNPDFGQCLNNLELAGEPIWGLSSDERELIVTAREKRNEC